MKVMDILTKTVLTLLTFCFLRNAECRYVPNLTISTSDGAIDISRFQEATVVLKKIEGLLKNAEKSVDTLDAIPAIIKKQRRIPEIVNTYDKALDDVSRNLTDGRDKVERVLKALANRVRSHIKATVSLAKIISDDPRPEMLNLIQRAEQAETEPICILDFDSKAVIADAIKNNVRERDYPSNIYGKKTSSYKKLHVVHKTLTEVLSNADDQLKNIVKLLFTGFYASKNIQKEVKSTGSYPETIAMDEDAAMVALSIANQILDKTHGKKGNNTKQPQVDPSKKESPNKSGKQQEPKQPEEVKEKSNSEPTKEDTHVPEPKTPEVKEETKSEPTKEDAAIVPEVKEDTKNEPTKEDAPVVPEPKTPEEEKNGSEKPKESEPERKDPEKLKEEQNTDKLPNPEEPVLPAPEEVNGDKPVDKPETQVVPDSVNDKESTPEVKVEVPVEEKPTGDEQNKEPAPKEQKEKSPNAPENLEDSTPVEKNEPPRAEDSQATTLKPEEGSQTPLNKEDAIPSEESSTPTVKKDSDVKEEATKGESSSQDQTPETTLPEQSDATKKDALSSDKDIIGNSETEGTPNHPEELKDVEPNVEGNVNNSANAMLEDSPQPNVDDLDSKEVASSELQKAPSTESLAGVEKAGDENQKQSSDGQESIQKPETLDPASAANSNEEQPEKIGTETPENKSESNSTNVKPAEDTNKTGEVSGVPTEQTNQISTEKTPINAETQVTNEVKETPKEKSLVADQNSPRETQKSVKDLADDTHNAEEPTSTPTEKNPAEEPTSTPTEKNPAEEPTSTPTEKNPAEEPTSTPTEKNPAEEPTSTPTEKNPAEEPTSTPTEKNPAEEQRSQNLPQRSSKVDEDQTSQNSAREIPNVQSKQESGQIPKEKEGLPESDTGAKKDEPNAGSGPSKNKIDPETVASALPNDAPVAAKSVEAVRQMLRKRKVKVVIFRKGNKKFRAETPLDANGIELKNLRKVFEISEDSPAGRRPARLTKRDLGAEENDAEENDGSSLKRSYEFPGTDDVEELESIGEPEMESLGYRQLKIKTEENLENKINPEKSSVSQAEPKLNTRDSLTMRNLARTLGGPYNNMQRGLQDVSKYVPSSFNQATTPFNQPGSYNSAPVSYGQNYDHQKQSSFDHSVLGQNLPRALVTESPKIGLQGNLQGNLSNQATSALNSNVSKQPLSADINSTGSNHLPLHNDGLDKPGIVSAGINAASNVAKATVHTVGAVGDAGLEIVGGVLTSAEGGVSALRSFFNY